jgi:hypothetical protein
MLETSESVTSHSRGFLRVADEDDVGLPVAADDGQLLAVIGVVEVADEFRLEVGELLSRRTVKILEPEIIGLAVTDGVNDSLAVTREQDRAVAEQHGVLCSGPFEIQEPDRLAEIDGQR